MTLSRTVFRALIAASVLTLAACTSKPAGTYEADFSSSTDPNVALAASLMKLSLTFEGDDKVTMEISALGNTEQVNVDAHYKDDSIVLTRLDDPRKQELVFTLEDANTLQCQQCPPGMPTVWKKQP